MSKAALKRDSGLEELDPDAVQRRASDPDASVWVGASAGSGKTTILTDRVMRLLLQDVPPQKILGLTFTRAAAAEMAIRITEGLSHWATCSDDELRAELDKLQGRAPEPRQLIEARRLFARLLSCPGGMRIRTIHAFCQEILRRFPLEANLPPHFTVIEEEDARVLQEDVGAGLLQDAADAGSALGRALQLLVRDFGEHGFKLAMREILAERAKLQTALEKAGSLDKLIAQMRHAFALAPEDSEESFRRLAVLDGALPRADIMAAAAALTEGLQKNQEIGRKLQEWLALPAAMRAARFDDYCDCYLTDKGELRRKIADKKTLAQLPDAEKILQKEAARLLGIKERLAAASMAEATGAVLTLGVELIRRYDMRKEMQAQLDYDDLILRTDALLSREGIAPWVLYKLDGGIDHILVDEAQDTSRAQWRIIAALADEFFAGLGSRADVPRSLFVVGDEKQSIFSFQHADPEAFVSMRTHFEKRIIEAEKPYREVPLRISFRSAPAILKAIDKVFADPRAADGVAEGPVAHYPAALRKNAPPKIGRVEVWPLLPPIEKDKANEHWQLPLGYETERDPQAELAQKIAKCIADWLARGERHAGSGEPIRPGDIMILLRRRGRFADLMVRALKEGHLPVTGVDRMCLVKQLPVMDLLALIQFALLPEDDLNLATVLRGPMLGLSEEQLMGLALGREGSLWQSLKEKAGDFGLDSVLDYLSHWLGQADLLTPFEMLAHILNSPCPASDVSGRKALWARLGPDALDPVDELLNEAQNFSHRHTPSLQAFLHWLLASEAEIKRELDRTGGQVRIMTVHAAKGLEAPIVFLPDAASIPRAQDVPKFLWDKSGAPIYMPCKPKGGIALNVWEEARRKQMQEYRRLLYVALTRAAGRLYIGGWENTRNENGEESWYALIERNLRELHEPLSIKNEEPSPVIAFADADPLSPLPSLKKKLSPEVQNVGKERPLPAWAFRPAPPEPQAPQTIAPSQLAPLESSTATPDQLFSRGRIIHRLLQSLPDLEDKKREQAALHFLANPQHHLSSEQQRKIAGEVLGILRHPGFAPLFAPGSRAEVPLTGHMGGVPIAGQVDRLCLYGDEVWIIDYKSNRPPPVHDKDVPLAYRQQLKAYSAVLAEIYPGKTIRCFLLWTYGPRLMEIHLN